MHAATFALLTKNEIIFWEHDVFVGCCHSNTEIHIFSVLFFPKKCENNGKNISFDLGFIYSDIFLFCHPYMLLCLKFGIIYDLLPGGFGIFKIINFYPHKFPVKPTFARILLHVKFRNILK